MTEWLKVSIRFILYYNNGHRFESCHFCKVTILFIEASFIEVIGLTSFKFHVFILYIYVTYYYSIYYMWVKLCEDVYFADKKIYFMYVNAMFFYGFFRIINI